MTGIDFERASSALSFVNVLSSREWVFFFFTYVVKVERKALATALNLSADNEAALRSRVRKKALALGGKAPEDYGDILRAYMGAETHAVERFAEWECADCGARMLSQDLPSTIPDAAQCPWCRGMLRRERVNVTYRIILREVFEETVHVADIPKAEPGRLTRRERQFAQRLEKFREKHGFSQLLRSLTEPVEKVVIERKYKPYRRPKKKAR